MALEGFHLRVAQILGEAVGPEGFALGGGYGLQSHHLADRPSEDLGSYVDKFDPEVFERAEKTLLEKLRSADLRADVVKHDDVFRAILVRIPQGEQVVIDRLDEAGAALTKTRAPDPDSPAQMHKGQPELNP